MWNPSGCASKAEKKTFGGTSPKSSRYFTHVPLHPWSWPPRPWQRIHLDFLGPFQGSMFLVVLMPIRSGLKYIYRSTPHATTVHCS